MSPAVAVADIEEAHQRYGVMTFILYDNTINGSKEHLEGLCREIIARGLQIRWTCLARPEGLDEATLRLMREAGCILISFGIESASPRVLAGINKNIDLKRVRTLLRSCKDQGIKTRATFMYDLPQERVRDLVASLLFIVTTPLDLVTFWPLERLAMAPPFKQSTEGATAAVPASGGGPRRLSSHGGVVSFTRRRILEALNFYYQRKADWLSKKLGLGGPLQRLENRID